MEEGVKVRDKKGNDNFCDFYLFFIENLIHCLLDIVGHFSLPICFLFFNLSNPFHCQRANLLCFYCFT
jgi:hypothetical protein